MTPAHQAIYDTLDAALTSENSDRRLTIELASLRRKLPSFTSGKYWSIMAGYDGKPIDFYDYDQDSNQECYTIGQLLREKHLTKGTE